MEPSPETNLSFPLYCEQPPSTTNSNCPQNPNTINFLNIQEDNDNHQEFPGNGENLLYNQEPKETMFEKVLARTNVKSSHLILPKQEAERYFPRGVDENGLQLNFEDERGQSWTFLYLCRNGKYYLRKGWRSFVKDKKLKTRDVVIFEQHSLDRGKRFIRFRRRAGFPAQGGAAVAGGGGNSEWNREYNNAQAYPPHPAAAAAGGNGSCIPYEPDSLHAVSNLLHNNGQTTPANENPEQSIRPFVGDVEHNPEDYDPATPVSNVHNTGQTTPASGNPKTSFRLFGSNIPHAPDDCEPETPDGSSSSSQATQTPYQFFPTSSHIDDNDHDN